MEVFAPMPSARVRIAIAVNPGCLDNIRAAKRISCNNEPILKLLRSQRDDRVNCASPPGRKPCRKESNERNQDNHATKGERVPCVDTEKQTLQEPSHRERAGKAHHNTDRDEAHGLADN